MSALDSMLARARIHAELDVVIAVCKRDRWERYGYRPPDHYDRAKVERLVHAYVRLDLASSVHQAAGREAVNEDALALVETSVETP